MLLRRPRPTILALLVLLLTLPSAAQQPVSAQGEADLHDITVRTWPPGAVITLEMPRAQAIAPKSGQGPPVSGEPVTYNRNAWADVSTFRLSFALPGYHKKMVILDNGIFNQKTEYPPADEPAIRLDPTVPVVIDLYYLAKLNPVPTGVVALGIIAFAVIVLPKRRARQKQERAIVDRAARIEELTASADLTDPLIKTSLGGYRIVEKLGSGGMATVYYAVPDESLDEREAVALKIIQRDFAKDPAFMKRFDHEVRVGAELRHPSIVSLYKFGEQDGVPFMALEYVKGESLRERIKAGGMPLAKAMAVLRQVFQGVAFAHSKNIIHRDLKPDNVMITSDDRVKVMDFGLARRHDFSKVTATGTALGTPAYMPPEQIMGQREAIDHRADQYALGIVAYELFCGRTPFDEEDAMSMVYKHLTEDPPPPRQFRPDLPAAAEAVILRMVAKDPNDRYPRLEDALQALEDALKPRLTTRMPVPGSEGT